MQTTLVRSRGVNSAVIQAHQHGVLTSTSLMVSAQATDEAVALAQANPDLSIGLHLVMVDGQRDAAPQRYPPPGGQGG